MLTVPKLAALARQENWRGLLRAALSNGPPLSRRLVSRLEDPGLLRQGALALATNRAAELSFRLDDNLRSLAERLMASQAGDGGFADESVARLAAGALEHAAMLERGDPSGRSKRLAEAACRARAWLQSRDASAEASLATGRWRPGQGRSGWRRSKPAQEPRRAPSGAGGAD